MTNKTTNIRLLLRQWSAAIQERPLRTAGHVPIFPSSIEDAQTLLTNWLSLPESNIPALFIVGSNDYESMLSEALGKHPLTANKRMLFFESDNPESLPVTTFRLSMYGASYLAGVTAAAYVEEQRNSGSRKDALILLAHTGDNTIATAGDGFAAGFRERSSATAFTEYLAQDWTGYVSVPLAYQRMSQWSESYDFIFPVAGGSNQGIYRYTREHPDAPLTVGMDRPVRTIQQHRRLRHKTYRQALI